MVDENAGDGPIHDGVEASGSAGGRGDAAVDNEVLQARLAASEAERARLSARLDEQLRHRESLNLALARQRGKLTSANAELAQIRASVSFRLGAALVGTARNPRRLFRLPLDMAALWRELWPRVRGRLGRQWHAYAGRVDLGPEFVSVDGVFEEAPEEPPIERLLVGTANAPELPDDAATMRIATVMDEFSFAAFRHCGNLRQVIANAWREQVEEFKPHMLLVESAWKGEGDSWARKIYPLSKELVELVAWCRERRIPTVFWNKEDPVHLSVFMRTARQFDFVFTTDIDCVRAYKSALGHDQVYWLPFACQPAEHHPIEEYQRKDGFCFAGSFYAKYPERQRDFAAIVQAMAAHRPVEIFDRNAGTEDPTLVFPPEYAPMIRGALPHDQISLAYKGYRYGININTVKQSQSMFARRAFDLLASNTVTVSNFSRGLRMLLGDLVISSDDGGQLADGVRPLLADERHYRKFRLAGLRKVMQEHTYQDRLRYVLEKVGGRPLPDDRPCIVVVGRAASAGEATAILEAFDRQEYPRKELVLLVDGDGIDSTERDGVTFVDVEAAQALRLRQQWAGGWIALFDPQDHYGPNYLTDLAVATRYADSAAIGKGAHHAWQDGSVQLRCADSAYQTDASIPWRRAMVRAADAPHSTLLAAARDGSGTVLAGACAIDEFNYCANGHGRPVEAAVGDLEGLWTGLPVERLSRLAEEAGAADAPGDRQLRSPELDATALAKVLPTGSHAQGEVRLVPEAGGLRLESRLASDKHTYIYTTRPLALEQLFSGEIGKFNLVVDSEMLISLVFVYLDDEGKRVGHTIRACSSNLSIAPPAVASKVRLGLRVQGPGRALIRRLVLGHVPSPVAGVPAAGRHLVISRGYPAYDNLYSYAYVHRRIKGYAEEGLPVDVFRLTEGDLAFSEFEGVDVVSGTLTDLELMIRTNPHHSLVVHSLDRALWSLLAEHAGHRSILVWIHGAEIQPWYRRDFSFIDDRDRQDGIRRSNDRMAFWRDLFGNPPDNVRFVFVSRHLAREAFRDVGIELDPSRYVVIHNHVDGELFQYQPKPADQRLRLLSIRPYTRPTYGNDLAVRAILDLVDEPFFPELTFRLIGDGRLFEETVEPVRHLSNVILEQRFLSQREIAALHKEHGVFLVPTRIDSQGVSRDEAMASGLVPITNRVSAVPEFVDERSAFLVDAEDWRGMADAVRRLHAEPETFQAMSAEAARRVRAQSSRARTLGREIELLESPRSQQRDTVAGSRRPRIALYGDLDLNRIDGSAVWAASLAQVMAGDDTIDVDLYLKAPISHTQVIRPLLGMVNVRLVEPPQGTQRRTPAEALDHILSEDGNRCYDAVLLRGLELARQSAGRKDLHGRLWVYLTDVPQRRRDMDAEAAAALSEVAEGATLLLCQTPQLQEHLVAMEPAARGKTRLLPPMVPGAKTTQEPTDGREAGPLRIGYAGKFAPLWGIREMFASLDRLRAEGAEVELHVFGDKIHNPPDDPGFRAEVTRRLEAGNGVTWHRGLDRGTVLAQLQTMDIGWAWRSPAFEQATLELSTKLLEYAQCGTPPLLARGPVNSELLGEDYPLFADHDGIVELLRGLARDPGQLESLRTRLAALAAGYEFDRVREQFITPLPGMKP